MASYFAAHTNHIGFYPANVEVQTAFKDELKMYETSKGTVRFPLKKKIPVTLIGEIVKFRAYQIALKMGKRG